MKIPFITRVGVGLALGMIVGMLMSLPFLYGRGELIESKSIMALWQGINAPAFWLVEAWAKTDLPPRNEAAWVFLPMAMVLVQWNTVGGLIGMWWALKVHRKNRGANGAASAKSLFGQ